jgi:hypothetical protein
MYQYLLIFVDVLMFRLWKVATNQGYNWVYVKC